MFLRRAAGGLRVIGAKIKYFKESLQSTVVRGVFKSHGTIKGNQVFDLFIKFIFLALPIIYPIIKIKQKHFICYWKPKS